MLHSVIDRRKHVAKDAVEFAWPCRECLRNATLGHSAVFTGDISVAPRRPEPVHLQSIGESFPRDLVRSVTTPRETVFANCAACDCLAVPVRSGLGNLAAG